ncbi:uncharacterized protein LOC132303521 [Cornus florida]|uniref:uncharacterized protein LOC132303521 n=1 Tax=Cornus florida TaxID=4283 RepID=UPI0028A01A63|nr:uncharacterized protein LOC132303521 [Cornus florida]
MKKLLLARFLPPDDEQIPHHRFQNCSQQCRSVSEYIDDSDRLNECNNILKSVSQQIERYIVELRVVDQNQIMMHMEEKLPKISKAEGHSFLAGGKAQLVEAVMTKSSEMVELVVESKSLKERHSFVPNLVQPISTKSQELAMEELPGDLIPIRDSQNHKDLVPNASVLDLQHHFISLVENEELQRKIEELVLMPRLDVMVDMVVGSKSFPQSNWSNFYQICIRLEDMWKTSFKTEEGHAYVVDLLDGMAISPTLDVTDLFKNHPLDEPLHLRVN